jgi:hypothetical protein
MAYTNGDDPASDPEIEGALARHAGQSALSNPWNGFFLSQEEREMARKLGQSWRMGWTKADQKIAEECAHEGRAGSRIQVCSFL